MPLLTWTKRIWRKPHFFSPLQQSIPNHFSLLVNFYSRVHLGYWNRSPQYLIYYTPRVIALLKLNSLPVPSAHPGFSPPTPICPGPLFFCPHNAFNSQTSLFCFLVWKILKTLGSMALKRENEELSRLEKINLPQTTSLKSCLPRVKN